ncbi:hypothetical protein [Winogradskyella sp.]|uniref:hypothetical protein n=1 Tax=Winogradskyella sp. TaxID=1883156 RepID=UPI003BA89A7A
MKVKKRLLLLITIAILAIIVGSFNTTILPDKYFNDANLIANDPYNEKGLVGSYSFSMWFYDVLGLNKIPFPLVSLIQLIIIFVIIKRLGIPKNFGKLTLRNSVVWVSLLLFSVYLSMPSKEFINFIYISLICGVLISSRIKLRKKVIFVCLLLLFFSFWFRPYYLLVPFLGIGLYFLSRLEFKSRTVSNIFWGIMIACFFSFSYGFIKGEFMSESSREKLNKRRMGREDSQTMIVSPVETDTAIGEGVGIFYGFFSVNLPLNGLKFFYKPQVVAFVIWQSLMFILLVYFYSKCMRNRQKYRQEEWLFHFVFAYLITQGVFEPDLGSAIKHKLGVFPIIYLAFYFDQNMISEYKKRYKYVLKDKVENH